MKKIVVALIATLLLAGTSMAAPTLVSGISFQDEGTLSQDDTALLAADDGVYGPSVGGTVTKDFYATGTANDYFDGMNLTFDITGYDPASLFLCMDLQQGCYTRTWHHFEVLAGIGNPLDEDASPFTAVGPIVDFGDFGADGLVGWVVSALPAGSVVGNTVELTVRLWNARVDQVKLCAIPAPGAVILSSLGLGLVGWLRRRSAL